MPAVDVGRGERVAGRNSATCTEKGEQARNSLEVVMRNSPRARGMLDKDYSWFDERQGPCVP